MELTRTVDHETALEVGFVLLALGVLAGLTALAGGRLAGDLRRTRRRAEPPPALGTIPAWRHQQLHTSPR